MVDRAYDHGYRSGVRDAIVRLTNAAMYVPIDVNKLRAELTALLKGEVE